jgi:hypothetical protein
MAITNVCGSPMALVAMARAANLAGDRELERMARRQLIEQFGIEISFRRTIPSSVPHSSMPVKGEGAAQ